MKKTNLLLAAAFSMALGSIAMNASACSTVVVGKDVSATGQIMIGHNEDNDLRIVTSQYWFRLPTTRPANSSRTNLRPPRFLRLPIRTASIGRRPCIRTAIPSPTASSMKTASPS